MPADLRPPKPHFVPPGPLAGRTADAALWLVRRLSARGRARLAGWVGDLAWALRIRRRITEDNLRHALPELPAGEREAIARGAYRNMALAAIEALTPEAAQAHSVRADEREPFWQAVRSGEGVLAASAHLGSWEVLGEALCRRGVPLSVVVRPLKGALNARIVQGRLEAGMALISPRRAMPDSLGALRAGRTVVMLIDQVLPAAQGVFVPFFGRPASTNPGLSLVAARSGKPVYLLANVRDPDGTIRVVTDGPYPLVRTGDLRRDLEVHTATLTAAIEALIRRYPAQWLWLHRRWKVSPPPQALPEGPERPALTG